MAREWGLGSKDCLLWEPMHEVARVTDDYSRVFECRWMSSTKVSSTRPPPCRYQLGHWFIGRLPMVEDQDYFARSQQFENLAAGSADPAVAAAYRTLAAKYRALDYWHQRWRSPPDPSNPTNPNGSDEQQ